MELTPLPHVWKKSTSQELKAKKQPAITEQVAALVLHSPNKDLKKTNIDISRVQPLSIGHSSAQNISDVARGMKITPQVPKEALDALSEKTDRFISMLEKSEEGQYYSQKLFREKTPQVVATQFQDEGAKKDLIKTFEKFVTTMGGKWAIAKDLMSEPELKRMQFIRAVIVWSAIDNIRTESDRFLHNEELYFDLVISGGFNIMSGIDFTIKFKKKFQDDALKLGGRGLQIEFVDEFNKQIHHFFGLVNPLKEYTGATTLDVNGYAHFYLPQAMTIQGAKRQDIQQLAASLLMLRNHAEDVFEGVIAEIFRGESSELKENLKSDLNKLNQEHDRACCIFFMRDFLIRNNLADVGSLDKMIDKNSPSNVFDTLRTSCASSENFDINWVRDKKLNGEALKSMHGDNWDEFLIRIKQKACSYYKKDLHNRMIEDDKSRKTIALFREKIERDDQRSLNDQQLKVRSNLIKYIQNQDLINALSDEVSLSGGELFAMTHYQIKGEDEISRKQEAILNVNMEIEHYHLEQEKLLQSEDVFDSGDLLNIKTWNQLNEEVDARLLETSRSAILSEGFAEECHIGEGAFRTVVEGSQGSVKKLLTPIQYLQAEIETVAFARMHTEKQETPFFTLIEISKDMVRNAEYGDKTKFRIDTYSGTAVEDLPQEYHDRLFTKDMHRLFDLRKVAMHEKQDVEIRKKLAAEAGLNPRFSIFLFDAIVLAAKAGITLSFSSSKDTETTVEDLHPRRSLDLRNRVELMTLVERVGNQLSAYQTNGCIQRIVDSFKRCERPIAMA